MMNVMSSRHSVFLFSFDNLSMPETSCVPIVKAGVCQLHVKQDCTSCINHYQSSKCHVTASHVLFPHLKVFDPEAPFLFTLRFLPWMLSVLNGSAIQEVTLQCKQTMTPHWSDLMTYIFIPTLEALTVKGHVSISALTRFLYNDPALKLLIIGAHSDSLYTTFILVRLPSCSQVLCQLTMLQHQCHTWCT